MLLLNYFILFFYQILKVYLFLLLLIFTGDILSIDFQRRRAGKGKGTGERRERDQCERHNDWLPPANSLSGAGD